MSKKVSIIITNHARKRLLTRMALSESHLNDYAYNAWHHGSEERALEKHPFYKNFTTYQYREYKKHIFVFSVDTVHPDGHKKLLLVTVFYDTKKPPKFYLNHKKKS